MPTEITNVIVVGLGGQGVIKASDILADAACRAGHDVKKAEIHGMSQRGGSVLSDVRFGPLVLSPMVPFGEADYLVVLAPGQIDNSRPLLRQGGVLIEPACLSANLAGGRAMNIALLGSLGYHLELPREAWQAALRANLPEKWIAMNQTAFDAAWEATGG